MVFIVGCQNDNAQPPAKAVAHPWEMADWDYPFAEPENGWGWQPGHPKFPKRPLPTLVDHDTFDPALLPGTWLQLAISTPDGVERRPLEEMHRIDFSANGKLVYHAINDGSDDLTTGSWEKLGSNRIRFTLGNEEGAQFDFQMHGGEFFFFFSSTPPQGYWFAKLPGVFSERILANRFSTSLGELHLKDIVGNSFSGTVLGEQNKEVKGVYNSGVLLMQWEEPESGNNGLAAFIVAEDWSTLRGIWWVNDFIAVPFGGEWNGTVWVPKDPSGV